ncbi:hypothetical protein L1D61_10335 [Vibrio mediterranei]|nr:hypothetical protein [Vibrio mediterranei]
MKQLIALSMLSLCAFSVNAQLKSYQFCYVAGFLQQDGSDFESRLATQAAKKQGILFDPVCSASRERGVKVHRKLTNGLDVSSAEDQQIIKNSIQFKESVQNFVLEQLGL